MGVLMDNLRRLLWILVLFPWLDFIFRIALPGFISSLWDELFIIAILVTLFMVKRHEPRYLAIPKSVRWPFYTYLLFCVSSIVVNVVPLAVSIDVMRVVYQPIFFGLVTMYLVDDKKLLDRFMNIVIISAVLIAILGLIQYVFQIELRWKAVQKDTGTFRIVSVFGNPNAFASYLNMILAFTVPLVLFVKDKKEKLLYLAASLPIFAALLLTFSRGAWIGFFFMVAYVVWNWNKKWLLALPVLGAISPFIMPTAIINRVKALFDPQYFQMSSEYGRISFWLDALTTMKNNLLFGAGMGMVGDSVPLRHNIPFSQWVDNHFLKIGAEIGVFGLLAFLLLLFFLFRAAHRFSLRAQTDKEKAYGMGIAGVIIVMATQNVTASIWEALAPTVYYYMFIGMLFALLWKEYKQKREQTS
jgi:O-antigen ligase